MAAVRHPETGQFGAFLGYDEIERETGQSIRRWGLERRVFPHGWALKDATEVRDAGLLHAQEFDPTRPFEAIRLDTHFGYGFFYLGVDR